MLEWREEGTVLSVRRHGEGSAIVELFTPSHGRHLGVVRGGGSRRLRPLLQPGAQLDATWRARLEDHMGAFVVEPLRSRASLLDDRRALAALSSVAALLSVFLPEREAQPGLYRASTSLLDSLDAPGWEAGYLRWELTLLDATGFGLSLGACAVTGSRDDLAYISPRTGRAVGRTAAGAWADRLLPLPGCLLGQGPASPRDLADGFRTTGYFLERHLVEGLGASALPPARRRLADLLARG